MSVRFSLPRLPEFAAKDPATYETFKALERAVNRILANTNVRVDETETVLGDLSDESYVVLTVTADIPNARSITSDSTITITDGGAGSTLTLSVSALQPYVAVTGTYGIAVTDDIVHCSNGPYTITLPAASGLQGKIYQIKNTGVGAVTIDADGSELIDGSLTLILMQYDAATLACTGTEWIIL